MEFTFLCLDIELIFEQSREDYFNMVDMFCFRLGIDENVINIGYHKLVEKVLKISLMKDWKMAGELASPYGITWYS